MPRIPFFFFLVSGAMPAAFTFLVMREIFRKRCSCG